MFAVDCSVKKVGDSLFLTPSERKNSRIKKETKFSVDTFCEGFVSIKIFRSNQKYNIMNCDFFTIVGKELPVFKEEYKEKREAGIKNLVSALKEQGFSGALSGSAKETKKKESKKEDTIVIGKTKFRKWINIEE
jgi:hypothetical protein